MKLSRRAILALVAIGVLWVLWLILQARSSATSRHVTAEIRVILAGERPWVDSLAISSPHAWAKVASFYKRRRQRPAWSDGPKVTGQARQLLEALDGLRNHGIDPARYGRDRTERLVKRLERPGPIQSTRLARDLAEVDVRLTHAFLLAARDLLHGSVPAEALDPEWLADSVKTDPIKTLQSALRQRRVPAALATFQPERAEYERLREALARYRAIHDAGDWQRVPQGDLRVGARGQAVSWLRRRLAASGDLRTANTAAPFDRQLRNALFRFQQRHGLEATGKVDAATHRALNVPVKDRIRQIELNLERWRWLPRTFKEPRVEVNVPDFSLAVMDSGRTTMAMRAIVGLVAKQTPIFSDAITYLEVNPFWRISKRILVKEILPELDKDLEYLTKQDMSVLYFGGKDTLQVDASAVNWARAPEDSFQYLVVQNPGPENPLGCIKIMCPNEYDVYLHDTPTRSLFGVHRRALSHGCVRLEQPVELATYLLGQQVERDSLEAFIGTGLTRTIGLKRKIPIYFLYWTAWADSANVVHFRDDLYGLERRLDRALRDPDSLFAFRVNLPAADSLSYP